MIHNAKYFVIIKTYLEVPCNKSGPRNNLMRGAELELYIYTRSMHNISLRRGFARPRPIPFLPSPDPFRSFASSLSLSSLFWPFLGFYSSASPSASRARVRVPCDPPGIDPSLLLSPDFDLCCWN